MDDYSIARADEAFLGELPWPQHLSPRNAHRTHRADREHQSFREMPARHDQSASDGRALNVAFPFDFGVGSGSRGAM